MSQFTVDIRDVRFNLFDFLDVGSLTEVGPFEDFDVEIFSDVLDVAHQQAVELLAPLNRAGDREGVHLEAGRVRLPAGFKEAYRAFVETGWVGLPIAQEHGGQGMPGVMHMATQDLFIGANVSFVFTPGLSTGALNLLCAFGRADQKAVYLEKMVSGQWSGTMCLTESGAGTAVPDLKTAATPIPGRDGFYKIRGQKIFISSGDHDATENIVHMVLGRVEGDPMDHTGVSLFIVPRMRPDGAGAVGVYNDVATVAIEEKMGIHASPTCQLSFGDDGDCEGWLIGGQGNGLRCMFQMMNEARISVGAQGAGLANAAYQQALSYARERIQGSRLRDMGQPNPPRVAIVEHPDVRRMLMHIRAIAEGSRALVLYAAYCHDRGMVEDDPATQAPWHHQVEVLTPIVKAWCSDEGFRAAEIAVQVHGGYGFIAEYAVEQILRDVKIASLYEGTNGIQALDLVGRKMTRKGGAMFMGTLNVLNRFLSGPAKDGPLAVEVAALNKARDAVAAVAFGFAKLGRKDPEYPALHATSFLQMFGDLVVGWLLVRQAVCARETLDTRLASAGVTADDAGYRALLDGDPEAHFLDSKRHTARFFVHHIMPRVHARRATIESGDTSVSDVVL